MTIPKRLLIGAMRRACSGAGMLLAQVYQIVSIQAARQTLKATMRFQDREAWFGADFRGHTWYPRTFFWPLRTRVLLAANAKWPVRVQAKRVAQSLSLRHKLPV